MKGLGSERTDGSVSITFIDTSQPLSRRMRIYSEGAMEAYITSWRIQF